MIKGGSWSTMHTFPSVTISSFLIANPWSILDLCLQPIDTLLINTVGSHE